MTVRNIRAYQARGVLEPPMLVRRTGYYDQSHVDRLETVRDLLESGLTLQAVHALLVGLSDLASDMTRLLSQVEPDVEVKRSPQRVELPNQRPQPAHGADGESQVIGISAMNQDPAGMLLARQALHDEFDLSAGDFPLDEAYLLVRRLDALSGTLLDDWITALAPAEDPFTDDVDPKTATRRLEQELSPAALAFAVALFDLALKRRAAERLAQRVERLDARKR
jgi:DNA-binding transcriptional MerR regulator